MNSQIRLLEISLGLGQIRSDGKEEKERRKNAERKKVNYSIVSS